MKSGGEGQGRVGNRSMPLKRAVLLARGSATHHLLHVLDKAPERAHVVALLDDVERCHQVRHALRAVGERSGRSAGGQQRNLELRRREAPPQKTHDALAEFVGVKVAVGEQDFGQLVDVSCRPTSRGAKRDPSDSSWLDGQEGPCVGNRFGYARFVDRPVSSSVGAPSRGRAASNMGWFRSVLRQSTWIRWISSATSAWARVSPSRVLDARRPS